MASAVAVRRAAAYRRVVVATRSSLVGQIERVWASLPDLRDPSIDRFARTVAPVVVAAQRSIAALTAAHLAALEQETLGSTSRVGIPAEVVDAIRGDVTPVESYRRAGVDVWAALADGVAFAEASERGLERARVLAVTDVQLAKTHAARHVFAERDTIVGYRRVPEADACPLCLAASTQRYRRGDLLPIHARCDCDVEPIFGDRDPGRTRDVDLDDAEPFDVHEHGELGPVLTGDGEHFTRASDL